MVRKIGNLFKPEKDKINKTEKTDSVLFKKC